MTNGSQIERPKLQADEPLNSENVVPTADPTPGGRWDKLLILLRVASVRLRFIGLFAAIFLVFAYWDTMTNYYDKWTRPASGGSKAGDGFEFWCPMCPQVVRDEMGICPICNMALSKRKKTNAEPLGEGVLARITLDAGEIVLAGVRVSEVKHVDLVKTINTFGFVDVDERRLVRISARVDGWIKKLHVDFTGKKIVRGDPLVDIYSPTLNLAIEELLIAQDVVKRSGRDEPRGGLLEQSKQKLRLLDVTDQQIENILRKKKVGDTLTIPAPQSGVVLKKWVVKGQHVQEGTPLYEIADLSVVWLKTQIYEDQLPYVREGQFVAATCSAHPGRAFIGSVAFIDPVVDRATRTVNVRIDLDNEDGALKPGMNIQATLYVPLTEIEPFKEQLASVKQGAKGSDDQSLIEYQRICPVTGAELGSMGEPVKTKVGSRTVFLCCQECEQSLQSEPEKYLPSITPDAVDGVLSIPTAAVIDMGARKVVYRETEPGTFEAIEVVLGPRVNGHYPVIRGLRSGDRVVAEGAFLLDAETRLNPAAAATYFGATGVASGAMETHRR